MKNMRNFTVFYCGIYFLIIGLWYSLC